MNRLTSVVGVDPSLSGTGLASITSEGVVDTKLVKRQSVSPLDLDATDDRLRSITGQVAHFTPAGSLVLIERLYVPQGRGADGSLIARAGLWHFIVTNLRNRGCVVLAVAPGTRAKLATGAGNAKKAAVTAAMKSRFPGVRIPDDNVADALAMAGAAAHWAGWPADGPLTEGQIQAMGSVAWPTREEKRS